MDFSIDDAAVILSRTPVVLRSMLDGLPERWTHANYGEQTFSPFDVVGHLIHAERVNWLDRARMILEHGPARTFEPFDRYAMYEASRGKSMADLLDEFERLRAANLDTLRAMRLGEAELAREGRHPDFGPVTLAQLLATWAVHDLHHTAQVCKAMAYQWKAEVGPWRAFLGILPKP